MMVLRGLILSLFACGGSGRVRGGSDPEARLPQRCERVTVLGDGSGSAASRLGPDPYPDKRPLPLPRALPLTLPRPRRLVTCGSMGLSLCSLSARRARFCWWRLPWVCAR